MNNKDIQLAIQENFEKGVDIVSRGEMDKLLGFGTVEICQNSLKKMGFVSQEDFGTNGWQWDYWETWKKDGKYFILSGCGNNGSCSFELSDVE